MNARSTMLSVALISLFGVLVAVYLVRGNQADTNQKLKEAAMIRDDQALIKAADERYVYSANAAVNANTIAEIQEQMLTLATQLNDLKSQLENVQQYPYSASSESVIESRSSTADKELDEAALQAKAQRDSLEQIMAIEDNFQSEMTDPGWSTTAESRLLDAFANQSMAEHTLHDMECRSTLCRLSIIHQDGADMTEFRNNLRDQISDILPAGAIRPGDEGGTVLYLAKDGNSLANMTASSH